MAAERAGGVRPAARPVPSLDELAAGVAERRPRALGRALSVVEGAGEAARELVGRLHGEARGAWVIGVTGPPGSGKSTLVDALARHLRGASGPPRTEAVAVLAVDPSSALTGGALLGDRIRMGSLASDPGIYIRSMATRGALGGLARASHDAIALLDAAGFDPILVETVGVGQDEVDVVGAVDSVVVVTVPGLGDEIQAAKAGLMEIADVFVVNKADLAGAERAQADLEEMLTLAGGGGWRPPVVATVARRDEGIEEVAAELERHRAWLAESGELAGRRRRRLRLRIEGILAQRVQAAAAASGALERAVEGAFARGMDPYRAADELFEELFRKEEG